MTALTKPQRLALIDAWPCDTRDAREVRLLRDLDCPGCGWFEMGQTVGGPLPVLLYCRRCGWAETAAAHGNREAITEYWDRFGILASKGRPALEALAVLAVRAWNPDLPLYARQANLPLAEQAAHTAVRCGLGAAFVRACGEVGPHGSLTAARRLLRGL